MRMRKVAVDALAERGAGADGGRVRRQAHSPVQFRDHGSDYLLPDLDLAYTGLARRLDELNPGSVHDATAREAARPW
jgi:hypothetical protein